MNQQEQPGHTASPGPRSRARIFAALCILCAAVAIGYGTVAVLRAQLAAEGEPARPVGDAASLAALSAQPHLLFRNVARRDAGTIGLVPLDTPGGTRVLTPLKCDRVHFAAGQGICLETRRNVILDTYEAIIFDANFRTRHTLPLSGIPSRARVSPDGRYAATTVFVTGDSYADQGFSTRTTLIDVATGAAIADLEQFAVSREGAQFREIDFNFWGVTFTRESNRFYATLSSGDKFYLIQGDAAARTARTLYENVECPSLSPDNNRIVFKRRLKSGAWQLFLLDTRTMTETPLSAETRSIDDQVEWLDDGRILYGIREIRSPENDVTNLWVLPIDGSGPPKVFVEGAASAAVVRSTSR